MKRITTRVGELDVHVLAPSAVAATPDASPDDGLLVVFCHGFGAPGTDLVGLAAELVALAPSLASCTFAFPTGPIDLSPLGLWGGRAWFPIDMQALDLANRAGRAEVLAGGEPPGMAAARKALRLTLDGLVGARPWSRVVLGGFSQGAMMALDVALTLDEAPAAVVAYSPTLVDRARWERLAARRRGLPVFVSHGRQDPLLPFAGTEALVRVLAAAGVAVELAPFDGPHTIAYDSLARSAELLAKLAAGGAAGATSSGT